MKDDRILQKNDQIFCENNHLVLTVLRDITPQTKMKVKHFTFAASQPVQKSHSTVNPCFCGKPWVVADKEGRAIPVKIKRDNKFLIPA